MKLFYSLLILIILKLTPHVSAAEDDIAILINVKEEYALESMADVTIEIKKDNVFYKSYITSASDLTEFFLPLDHGYHLYIKKKGYGTKFLLIDTRNIPLIDQEGGFSLELDITLFYLRKGFDERVLLPPIGKAAYDSSTNSIEFDFPYTNERLVLINEQHDLADSANQDRFNKFLKKAKNFASKGNQKKALHYFKRCHQLIPSDESVRRKLKLQVDDSDNPKI